MTLVDHRAEISHRFLQGLQQFARCAPGFVVIADDDPAIGAIPRDLGKSVGAADAGLFTGRVLASGHTSGGGYSGAAPFEFSAYFEISEAEAGLLEVFEPDVSDGEGFPSPRTLIPLALIPDPSQVPAP